MRSPQQYRFLADHVDLTEPARREVEAKSSRRGFTYKYSIKIKGVRHQMCEKMFLATLSLKDSSLRKTKLKLQQGITCFDDGRGRTRGVNKFQITDETKNRIRQHIMSFKTRESHYARKDAGPQRRYLDAGLSVARMHAMYNENMLQQQLPNCSLSLYRHIFKSEFDLRFGNPVNDSCGFCDDMYALICRETNESKKAILKKQHSDHLVLAENARQCHKNDRNDPENGIFSITTDMEKVLFVPQLSCGEIFFKRTLSTFNLGIHETGTKNAFVFLWDQTVAKHSAQDVISCVWKYVTDKFDVLIDSQTRSFIIWSDRCIGQYNNGYMVLFMKFLVDKQYFTQVDHKFLCTGHSYMECDRDFGLVENRFKDLRPIVPTDVDEVIKTARLDNPFIVTRMRQTDFLNFNSLADLISFPNNFKVTKFLHYRYTAEYPNKLQAKRNHCDEQWEVFNFRLKIKSVPSFHATLLQPTNRADIPIQPEKAQDLRSLMTKIPDKAKHDFYDSITKFVVKN